MVLDQAQGIHDKSNMTRPNTVLFRCSWYFPG